MQICIYWRQWN